MNYELFYSNGGHCGPYKGLDAAKNAAQLRVGDGCRYVAVVPYSKSLEYRFGLFTAENHSLVAAWVHKEE